MEPVPQEAFSEILQELQRQPLPINKFRRKVGLGRSNTMGLVNRRSLPPDYSRYCWFRPYLYKLLLDYGHKNVPFPFTSITINENYSAGPHRDKGNQGDSYLVAFGSYTGGNLKVWEGDLSGSLDICNKPIVMDFTRTLHSVEPWIGNRYSLVYYNLKPDRIPADMPAPSVKLEAGKWIFYRGDTAVTRKKPLPHPLRNRIKKHIVINDTPVTVTFN